MSMTPHQCRMARAALGWSSIKLAETAQVRQATVSNFETGGEALASTITKLRAALEAAGVIFIAESEASLRGGVGVRLRGKE